MNKIIQGVFLAGIIMSAAPHVRAQTCFADAGRDTTVCSGACITLGGQIPAADTSNLCSSVIYRWSPSTGLNNPNLANPTACPTVSTTYTLVVYFFGATGTDTCCVAQSSVTVTISGTCQILPELNTEAARLVLHEPQAHEGEELVRAAVLFVEPHSMRLTYDRK